MRLSRIIAFLLLLAIIGAGVFLWRLPADVGYRYGVKRAGAVALSGLSGTVWDGHADGISVFGNDLGEVDWHLPKLSVLGGKPVADVRIKGSGVDVAGQVERLGHGFFGAHDLRFSVPASMFDPLFAGQGVTLDGTVSGVLDDASMSNLSLQQAKGNAHWSGVAISNGQSDLRFSDLSTEFAAQPDGGIGGTVKDDGSGNLAIDGRFNLRVPMFEAQATLRARNGDEETLQFLRGIGEPQADGSTIVRAQGSMLSVH